MKKLIIIISIIIILFSSCSDEERNKNNIVDKDYKIRSIYKDEIMNIYELENIRTGENNAN